MISDKTNKILSLIGISLIILSLGHYYLWGSINIYLISYYKQVSDASLDNNIGMIYMPLVSFPANISTLFALTIVKKIGFRAFLTITWILLPLSVFLSSIMNNFYAFLIFYAVLLGISSANTIVVLYLIAFKYFVNSPGIVSGIIQSSFAVGGLIANIMAVKIINPDNLKPNINYEGDAQFTLECAERIFSFLKYYSLVILILVTIGNILIKIRSSELCLEQKVNTKTTNEQTTIEIINQGIRNEEPEQTSVPLLEKQPENDKNNTEKTLWACVFSRPFLHVFLIAAIVVNMQASISLSFKDFGLINIPDDEFVTICWSLALIVDGITRFLWGWIFDKLGFKKLVFLLLSGQLILALTFVWATHAKASFIIVVVVNCSIAGGFYTLFPALLRMIFGPKNGSAMLGYLFLGYSLGGLSMFLLKLLSGVIGFDAFMHVEAFLVFIGLVSLRYFNYVKID